MSEKSIHKQFYGYLWAYILVALSGCLGNVVDGIIVGNLISEDGVSAIALSLTVIPVLWIMSKVAPGAIWYSYLIAYVIEAIAIYILHRSQHIKFELKAK